MARLILWWRLKCSRDVKSFSYLISRCERVDNDDAPIVTWLLLFSTLIKMAASPEQIGECFAIFDKDNDGKVSIEDLGSALRSLGKNPTNTELKSLRDEIGGKDFDLATFKAVYRKPIKTPQEQQKEMLDAFKALDKEGNGYIQEAELRQLLLNLGDALTTPEVEELMKEVSVSSDGGISYESFVDLIVNGYPVTS